MAKEYKVGEGYFLPVKITSTDYDREFPVQFSYFDGRVHYTECVQDGTLLTAEEIVKASNLPAVLIEEGLTARITELEAKNATLAAELEKEKANTNVWVNTAEERGRLIIGLKESLHEASEENSANDEALAQMNIKKAELEAKLAESEATIAKQTNKLMELQARIVQLNEVNSSLGENRDALNDEAAVHMTSIHNLQVAVEVLAEKIFEMRCEQDG